MGERRPGESGETGVPPEPEEPGSLLQRAVSVLQSSSLDSSSQLGLQFSKAILVENDLFLSELKAFAKAKEAAGYSQEELQETFAFLLFDKEEEAKAVCQSGLRVNSSSISTLGDPAKGVYISKYSDFLQPRPWHPGKSGYIVICKLIKGKVRAVAENPTSSFTVPSPGYDCHESCTSRSTHSLVFLPQYYVYEVSGGSTAERPRQVCPYIFLSCQYREPKEMPVLASQRLYCPWRGQLSIQGRLLCTIALRNRYSPTIPAQLPPNLDISHVMGLADLKKKLPEAAFGKKNYTGHEVCFQGIYSSLYEVEISNKDQSKMDQLLEKLKEKDLAIIKYLRDQGVLILLTSSALAREEGLDAKEPVTLLALFLFPSPRALSPPAAKQDPKDVKGTNTKNSTSSRKEHHSRNSIPLKITSVLPGLRYALRRAADSSCSTTSAVKGHLQEYSKLQENSAGKKIPVAPAWEDDEGVDPPRSQKLSARSLAQLRRYLRDPESYTLAISAALGCLSRAGRSSGAHPHPSSSSSALPKLSSPPRGAPTPFLDDFSKSVTSPTKPWGRKSRRKSSRTPGKNPAPQKAQTNPEGGGSKSKGTAKKKNPLASSSSSSSCPKNSGGSGEPMLKLANLRLPHGRKRGAEVLAAEIVHKPQGEGEEKESSAAPNGGEAKKPKTLENSDTKKVPGAESGPKAGKNKLPGKEENKAAKSPEKLQEQSGERGLKEPLPDLPSKSSSQSQGGPNSESHALNLLADLALGSCIPPFIPKDSGLILLESRDSTPQSLPVASDHKYHKADKEENQKKPTSSGNKTPQNQQNPKKTDPKDDPPADKTSGIVSSKLQVFSPQECADVNKHSIISDEHSYASPMPEDPKNPSDPKANPSPELTPPKSSSRNVPGAPLVGKVLPFRHHHSNSSESAQSRGWGRKKEEFSKRHTVTVCGNSLRVTCAWEEEYLFHLDSRYTNDSLEKTVIRALHGPWDPHLPDDLEGMKLILHMWVALFYRKPSKLLSTSRKVVEHINPKKFVSINSSGAFLELSDDSQDCFGLETCPADSAWDPDQTPSSSLDPSPPSQGSLDPSPPPSSSLDPSSPSQGSSQADKEHSQAFPADSQTDVDGTPGDSTVSSSSGELPCGEEEEPSSTSCAEGVSLQDHSGEKLEREHGELEVVPRESGVCSGSAEEAGEEELLEARTPPSPSQDTASTENPGSQSPNSSTAPRTEPQEEEEQQEGDSGSGPGPPEDEEGPGDSGRALEVEDDADPQAAHHSTPSGANPGNAEPGGATEEGEGSQEPSERSEKEKEVEEEENEEFEDEGSFQSPVDLVLSESSDAEMECEQNPGTSASPEEFGAPEEEPAASPTSLPSPCPQRSPPGPSAGAGSDPGDDPQEVSPRREQLPGPSGAEVGSPHSPRGELQFPPEPSPARGAQPDSRMDSPAPPGDTLGCSEQENRDQAPSGERWERAGSTESPCGQGMSLALSPDSSSACLTSPDGSLDPWAAPEDQPTDSVQSPAQSELGRSSCLSQLGGDEAGPHLNSLDNEESNQGGNEVLGEEEQGSPCAEGMEELDDPMGAGDDLEDSPLDYPTPGDECRAEERGEDEFPEAENSPGNDTTNMELEPEIPLPEPEPSSSSREGISAIQELPRQEQNFPNIPGEPTPGVPGRRESVLCRLWKPCREGGAAQLSIPAWSLHSSLQPSCSQELVPAPCSSPGDELGPAELGSAPPSPCDPWDDEEEPLPEVFPPSPDSARWSRGCDSPRNSRGSPEEEEEDLGAGRTPSPAPFPSWECALCEPWDECEHNPEGSQPFPDPDCADPEVGEGEIPNSPIPASPWDEHGDLPGDPLEFSGAEEIPEQLPSQDTHEGLAFEDPSEMDSFGDSEQEYFEGNSHSPLPSRNSCIVRSTGAAGARTSRDSSSRSSLHGEEHGEDWDWDWDWDWDVPRDPRSSVLGRQCRERMDNSQLPRRRPRRSRESHLARSLMGTWRSFEELTQNTLDMECLRFHYKLKETLRNSQPPFSSTSRSLFPPRPAPIPPSPRSRSPLQVTIPPSDTWPHRDTWPSRPRGRSRDPGAPLQLGKLRYHREPPEPRGDIGLILDEYSHFQRVVLGRAPRAGRDPPGPLRAGNGLEPFRGMVEELRGALRSQLHRVAAAAQPGMFFLLETGQEPLFDTVKALLQARGFVRTDPAGFLGARRRRGERLLVIVRSEDVSSHIHTVPSLLELKRCPSVVFAGVDDPEELTGDTFQELFQAGGFVVSDEELLERVTLAQLQEVLKVLERLNRNGRWKWLLHHRESRRLRGDLRDDAQKKQLLLRRCQGEELLELLPFHACDSAPAGPRRVPCLLELQVQHVHARFAVYLTEDPGSSREILESQGILVADINTFLGTVQELAAPFRRSYW
ncbi:hypothetical protein HGM15179_016102 [Zosterops borbonicus]|uniref:Protein FAM208B n=1 Tax=Zosterops borbonicus TaxID=364589 RepID=A0A8K1G3F0_9PASS|nr:hypothetical protein HGM15179_016102 [Zosterops borbonicus]